MQILAVLRRVLPKIPCIPLHESAFAGNEWAYIKACLDTGWVSSVGKYVARFEQQLAEYTGVKRAVAVVNSTAVLHVCLPLVGVEQGAHQRDALLEASNSQGIMIRPAWTLMHKLQIFADCPRMDLAVAENLESRLINIPSSAALSPLYLFETVIDPNHG